MDASSQLPGCGGDAWPDTLSIGDLMRVFASCSPCRRMSKRGFPAGKSSAASRKQVRGGSPRRTRFLTHGRDRSADRSSGAGRIHAAVFDACQLVVSGHSCRGHFLRLHPQPWRNYCNGVGYGEKITEVDNITLSPQTGGISMAFGFGMKLNAVKFGSRLAMAAKRELLECARRTNSVGISSAASPWLIQTGCLLREPAKRPFGMIDLNLGVAVFPVLGFLHPAAEMLGHELHPVADPEDRQSQLPDPGIRARRVGGIDARGPPDRISPEGGATCGFPRPSCEREESRNTPSPRARAARSAGCTGCRNRG